MRIALLTIALLSLAGCDDLSRFATDGDAVYRGTVVGDEADSFVRRGFAPGTVMELEFDPRSSDVPQPGSLTTSPDPITGERVFDATPLESIPPLQHDLLSEYEFPGGGRVQNYLYVARPVAGPLAGRDVMIFLSLLDDGSAEIRVIAGTGEAARGDHFGVFRLRREQA
ncbi:MAG: hypothetical protein M3Y87_33235 [Myxococcota bacterium]|nr:hypothetical protein [Myxococcota bacterium]